MPDHSYFANLLWQIADLLRGPYRPPQYERVMLPMTVLRRFDCVLAPTKARVLVVRTSPPTDSDFRSQRAEKPSGRFPGVTECQARGLSVFALRKDAERALRLPNLRGCLLCRVQLEAGAGHIQQTGRPSHHTWWPLAEFNILARCAMETS